jgi:hypothetical protein
MTCCGDNRRQFQVQRAYVRSPGPPARVLPGLPPPKVVFEYSGRAPMVVTGPASGRRYIFGGPGARAEVDPRDRRSLAMAPALRQVT